MRMTKIVLALLIVTFVVACNKKEATGTTEPAAAAPEMTAPSQGTAEVKSEGDQMSAPIGNAAPATMNTEGSANMGESNTGMDPAAPVSQEENKDAAPAAQ